MKLLNIPWVQKSPEVLGTPGWQGKALLSWRGGFSKCCQKTFCSIYLWNKWHQGPHVPFGKWRGHIQGPPWGNGASLCFDSWVVWDVFLLRKSWNQKCWVQTKVWPSFLDPFSSVSFFFSIKGLETFVGKPRWKTLTDSFSNAQEIICAIKSHFDIIKNKIK